MADRNKIEMTCSKSYAACVEYQKVLPAFSNLTSCASVEETIEELYEIGGDFKSEIELSALGNLGLTYILDADGKKIVKNVLLKYEQEISALKTKIETLENRQLCDIPITDCLSDFSCLELPCNNTIITLKDWMMAIQNKVCEI